MVTSSSLTLSLFFSFLFAFSEARIAFPEFRTGERRNSGDAKEPSIRLPSEKLRPDNEKPGFSDPASADPTVTKTNDDEIGTVPMMLLNFHPINRRFAHTRRFPIRIPHRCRHYRRRPTITRVSAFKYGDDMALPSDFYSEILAGPEGREMPEYYPNLDHHHHHHHHHHSHHDDDGVVHDRSVVYHGPFPNRFYQHKFGLEDEPRKEPKEDRKERDDNVVVKSIRKFLGQF